MDDLRGRIDNMTTWKVKRRLSHAQVWEIREARRRGVLKAAATARAFGVNVSTVTARYEPSELYPLFERKEHAEICDRLQSRARETGEVDG